MYTPKEVAAFFSVNVATVYRWIKDGRLRVEKLSARSYRIPVEEIKRFKESSRT